MNLKYLGAVKGYEPIAENSDLEDLDYKVKYFEFSTGEVGLPVNYDNEQESSGTADSLS